MKDTIQKFISLGDTEKALELLATRFPEDAAMLQAQFNNGKKEFNLNLLDYTDWQRIQSKVNYAALELAGKANTSDDQEAPKRSTPAAATHKVFISYSQQEKSAALEVKKFLENEGCAVIIDAEDMGAGNSIMAFIQNSIKTCDVVISMVSSHSLQSDWVGGESVAAMYAVWLADKKFIPLRLDNVAFDIDFQIAAQETLNNNIKALKAKIKKLEGLGGDARAFQDDLNRMNELKNNMGIILQRLKSVLMLYIGGPSFTASMQKVVAEIRR